MTTFNFLHVADIHLDSPLNGLARYDGVPAEDVRGATRAAFDNLIVHALDKAVDFVLIAGDLFDGDWKDMGTGLYFARAMGRLAAAGIPVYVLGGNHDAVSVLTRSLPWPDNVHQFKSRRAETLVVDRLRVAIHGRSFAVAQATENLAGSYPDRVEHHFNIGMLHTALNGREGHAPYAPCTLDDLRARHYDYWALGHVHEFAVLDEHPHIVYPGNLQGRHIRETGPKGAVHVEVEDGTVVRLRHVPFDTVRWSRIEVDCGSLQTAEDVEATIRAALSRRHAEAADGRPLIVRVVLTGTSALAGDLRERSTALRDNVRALATAAAPDLWIEKVQVEVVPPRSPTVAVAVADDFAALLAESGTDPAFAAELKRDLAPFLLAAAKAGEFESDSLVALAERGEWSRLLAIAGGALTARLSGGEAA